MRIATCTVSYAPATAETQNEARLVAFAEALRNLAPAGVDLFALPAGYFHAASWPALEALAERVGAEASAAGLAVAAGIDLDPGARPPLYADGNGLTAFTAGWSPASGAVLWQQRSTNTADQWNVPAAASREPRTLVVAGRPVEVLNCGEIFNERIRGSVLDRGAQAVVDLGHVSRGFRVHAGMKILTRYGVGLTLCSVHCGPWGQKYCYTEGAVARSSRRSDLTLEGQPRIEVAVWDVDEAARLMPAGEGCSGS